MLHPASGNTDILFKARQSIASATTVEQLRQVQAGCCRCTQSGWTQATKRVFKSVQALEDHLSKALRACEQDHTTIASTRLCLGRGSLPHY